MEQDWNRQEPAEDRDAIGQLAQASRLLQQERRLVLPGTGLSVKVKRPDLFGEQEEILYVHRVDRWAGEAEPEDVLGVQLEPIARLTTLDHLSEGELVDYIERNAPGASTTALYREAVLHAALPYPCVVHIYPDAVLAMGSTPQGMERLTQVYGDSAVVLPYAEEGLPLAKLCAEALSSAEKRPQGLVLMQQGVLGLATTLGDATERALELAGRAEEKYVADTEVSGGLTSAAEAGKGVPCDELPGLRRRISDRCGCPIILTAQTDPEWVAFALRGGVPWRQAPISEAAAGLKWNLLRRDLGSASVGPRSEIEPIPAVGAILDPEWGMCSFGRTAEEAQAVAEVYRHGRDIILGAEALGGYRPLRTSGQGSTVDVDRQPNPSGAEGEPGKFTGEIALVTGAASGIGRACVDAFLARGAAVVGLDINPDVVGMLDRDDFLGLECDVTDEARVCEALEATVRTFGGLDMLVPNAGVFPPGRRIDALSGDEWDRVMAVNLDANLALMREAYPLLKASPKGGRVVIMGSRNVPAPGPGAVAYSVSKAGLVQIGRVAALEWGGDGIRVNIINPHAVFDTGIWTDEVLQARADHYGLTVEEYKTRNVLGVEVTSRDVGELVAEMCGPLFDKTTGAQIPIDGGSERVV